MGWIFKRLAVQRVVLLVLFWAQLILAAQYGMTALSLVIHEDTADASSGNSTGHGNETLDLKECFISYELWYGSWVEQLPTEKWRVTQYHTAVYETIKDVGPGTVYTACDGIPRF
jgi:hypothetical protein